MKTALAAATLATLVGCQAARPTAGPTPPVTPRVAAAPTFGVGDELGWLAFGDLALAPLPGEPRNVLVIAAAPGNPGTPATPEFDWVGRYLALAY
ncbi:MAG: hypothetical protein AAF710_02210 [Planctomycetota bacterium]